jgi:hypothetical protein
VEPPGWLSRAPKLTSSSITKAGHADAADADDDDDDDDDASASSSSSGATTFAFVCSRACRLANMWLNAHAVIRPTVAVSIPAPPTPPSRQSQRRTVRIKDGGGGKALSSVVVSMLERSAAGPPAPFRLVPESVKESLLPLPPPFTQYPSSPLFVSSW